MTERDLAEALGRNPGVPAEGDELDPIVPVEEEPGGSDGDGEYGTEGRNPG